jgi:predicted porin
MKKNLIAVVAALAASGGAFAQSSVTLYGIADVWVGSVKAAGVRNIVVESGGISGSRFGLRGAEDLGGGLKANFLLEQGFAIDTGAAGTATPYFTGATASSQAFSRQAYVGLSGGFGEAKLGKMWTAYDDISGTTNAAFDSALSPQNGVWASTGYQANPGNSIYYGSPNFGGISGALSYSLGENKTAAVSAGSIVSTHLKYEGGPLYAGVAYQAEKADGSVTADKFTRLNGSYDLGFVKVLAGFGRFQAGDAKTDDWQVGADVPIGSLLTISGGYARSKDNAAAGSATRSGVGLAAMYALSKRTSLYGGIHTHSTRNTDADDVDIFAVGVKHTF